MVRRHSEIAAQVKKVGRYSGAASANLTMMMLRTVWNHAAESDDSLPPSPTRRLRKAWYPIERRTRHLSVEQLPKFYRAVKALPSEVQRDFLLMLLFTGMRLSECASLEWTDVDLASKTLTVPGERTKSKRPLTLPLTTFTFDLLKARRALGNTKYVFPARSGHLSDPKHAFRQVREATGIEISAHDLRRGYATAAEACDLSYTAIKALIGHTNGNDVTAGYVIVSTERLREPAQKVCDRLKVLCRV